MKRHIYIIAVLVLLVPSVAVGIPKLINYQGRLTDSGGTPITGSKSIVFSLYNGASGGSPLWTETQPTVTITDGVFNVLLGSVNAVSSSVFDNAELYLGINVESDGEMSPRRRVTSVGYAFKAEQVENVDASSHNHDSDYVDVTGDTMTGAFVADVSLGVPALWGKNSGAGYGILGLNTGSGFAVGGLVTGIGKAGYFVINNNANSNAALHAETNGTGYSGHFIGGDGVYISGDLDVTGALSKGSGTFVQPHPNDPTKELVYAFFEGPEHAVFLRGTATLVDGRAVIETPGHFRAVAGKEGITVQFTPRSSDTFGLAAVDIKRERIVVEELKGETHTYEFDYFITAKRAGFEAHEPVQPNTHFTADMKTAEEFEKTYASDDMTISAMRELLISNGILTAEGKLDMETVKSLGWTLKEADVASSE